jgi:hypothetical protein
VRLFIASPLAKDSICRGFSESPNLELLAYRTVGCCTAGIWSPQSEALKLDGMRLPQSILRSLSVRASHFLPAIAMAIFFVSAGGVRAGAATPQMACSPAHLAFGVVALGQSETLLVTVTNEGQTSVTVSGAVASGPYAMSQLNLPLVLPAAQSFEVSVTFTPTVLGWTGGRLNFSSDATIKTLVLELGGAGVSSEGVTSSPSAVSFGGVTVGMSTTLPVTLTNERTWKVTLSSVQTTGSAFSMSGLALPVTLASGQSVTLDVSFTPQSAGVVGGSLLVEGPGLSIPLTGTGATVGQLTFSPALLSFGNVPEGTTQSLPLAIGASGGSVTVSSASSSSAQFALEGASFPLTIAVGQTVSFNVAFTPESSGTLSGALAFASNASNSPALESLTGVGTVTQYSVSLSWSPSSNVQGYNVYRSPAAKGTYTRINSTLNPSTAYVDSTVASGQTYYYSATSVNSSGQESALSTPAVQAVVP